jgi:prepilin-type processing-associated H-X9-DG protein
MNIFDQAKQKLEPSLTEILKKRNEEMVSVQKAKDKELSDHIKWVEKMEKRPLNVKKKNRIKGMLKILNGLPPHNSGSNICYGDGYYFKSIPSHEGVKEFDTAIEELVVEFGEQTTWLRFMDKELKY